MTVTFPKKTKHSVKHTTPEKDHFLSILFAHSHKTNKFLGGNACRKKMLMDVLWKSKFQFSSMSSPGNLQYSFEFYILNVGGRCWEGHVMLTCFSHILKKESNINVDTAMDKWISGYQLVDRSSLLLEEEVKYQSIIHWLYQQTEVQYSLNEKLCA